MDEITRQQTGVDTKIICLQLLRFDEDGREQIRVGYYVIGKKPKMRGRWVWGAVCDDDAARRSIALWQAKVGERARHSER